MKNLKRFLVLMLVLMLILSLSSCKKEKSYLDICIDSESLYKSELIDRAELIVRGRVLSKNYEEMSNPDGTKTDSSGVAVSNAQYAEYTVEIYDVYKGEYTGDTVNVMTENGRDLSPDLILYGEDDDLILGSPLKRIDLDVGKECILLLVYVDKHVADYSGYYPYAKGLGYYPLGEDGKYVALEENSYDDYSFTLDTIEKEIIRQ